jgi:hypothetical protein
LEIPITLAQAAYEERELPSGHLDNTCLAVLSDALEEAGCTDDAILMHLRSPGLHVRGCWETDLLLTKEGGRREGLRKVGVNPLRVGPPAVLRVDRQFAESASRVAPWDQPLPE